MPQKSAYIRDFTPGSHVSDLFLISEARLGQSRNGPFWNLLLSDASGRVEAKIWSPLSQRFEGLASGQVVRASGQVEVFREKNQLNIREMEVLDEPDHDLLQGLVPVSEVPPVELMERLEDLLREHLTHKPWKTFVFKVLNDEEVRARMLAAPGAKAIHHAYSGGLLEHTLAVCRICASLAALYPEVDKEALLAAAAFHDLGKAWELTSGPASGYTAEGRLLGHINLCLEILEPFFRRCKSLDEELVLHFKHMILSHHGEYEFGSPKRPKTSEAMLLHYADQIDAKMNTVAQAFEPEAEPGDFSPFVRALDRFLYKPARTPRKDRPKDDKEPPQCLLPLKG
ncbi:3'-5' exoribonuclease YhaM family protein [Desulfohalovibrio reitneri]|uniref:3'-5' exoribonuclease YhaM family protein n=1 Tax=Desulfohalovibrio reitneri TaxID=1307759 RepID=UPI0004A6EBEC|nr:HD domain-containing protein [Desulfohalovibrio reitneri]